MSEDSLIAYLRDRDVWCPGCGYNLRGLQGNACPECAVPVELRVGVTDAAWGTLIGTIVGLTVGGGTMLALLLVAVGSIPFGYGGMNDHQLLLFVVYPAVVALVFGVGVVFLASRRGRRWFRARSDGAKTGCVVAGWFASGIVIVGWALWVFG
jgi:hypothetical protein